MPSPSRPFPSAASPPPRPLAPELHDSGHAITGRPIPRLWRSRSNRLVVGVIGGLAEKFGLEAQPLRLLYGLVTFATMGVALVPYLAVWAITRPHGPAPAAPRFWRSRTSKVVAGVIGGLAEKWGANSFLLRGVYAAATVVTGGIPGVLLYLLLWTGTRPLDDPRWGAR
jgi:phage shock protein PspC (stress-responsive transcriptional regulator)